MEIIGTLEGFFFSPPPPFSSSYSSSSSFFLFGHIAQYSWWEGIESDPGIPSRWHVCVRPSICNHFGATLDANLGKEQGYLVCRGKNHTDPLPIFNTEPVRITPIAGLVKSSKYFGTRIVATLSDPATHFSQHDKPARHSLTGVSQRKKMNKRKKGG